MNGAGARATARDDANRSCLHYASRNGHTDVVNVRMTGLEASRRRRV